MTLFQFEQKILAFIRDLETQSKVKPERDIYEPGVVTYWNGKTTGALEACKRIREYILSITPEKNQ